MKIYLIGVVCLMCSCSSSSSENESREILPEDFTIEQHDTSIVPKVPERAVVDDSMKLMELGYNPTTLENGQEPDCFNYLRSIDNKIDNSLEVNVGNGTDVVIKLMSRKTAKCIRYFYIKHGSTYVVKNIPEGDYYLKIGYGKSWMINRDDEICIGRFLRNSKYELGDETLAFKRVILEDRVEISSYKLTLDMISSEIANSFNSTEISEAEFNQ